MKAILALLLGVATALKVVQQVPLDQMDMATAWQLETVDEWDALEHKESWYHWKKTFDKSYPTAEHEANAFVVFLDNWKAINEFNSAGNATYTMKMNQFSDMTPDQFKLAVHGHTGSCLLEPSLRSKIAKKLTAPFKKSRSDSNNSVPTAIDWTNVNGKSYVSAVKNQGSCGSCWAFSTTGSIEARTAIAKGVTGDDITTLSEQQLIDCSKSEGNMGCNGGLMDNAFKYVESAGGLCTEDDYPYTAKTGTECLASSCTVTDAITGYQDVTADSEDDLMAAVAKGPVSIAIEADQRAFQFYSSGVLSGNCGDRLDHGVLVVGYGEEDGQKFWKVKNSWGSTWGEDGYVLICRECDANQGAGECGILMSPSYPQV